MISYLDAVDDSGTIYISPQVTEVLGYTPQEFYRDPGLWTRIVHTDDLPFLDEDPLDAEYRLVAKDGHIVWVHDLARLIVDEVGTPRYWQGVLIDLTARREAAALREDLERERAEAERLRVEDEMKNTFLQAVSHDLRTPLAAILGLAVTLDRHHESIGGAEIHDLTQRIASNARRLDRIVADFLDLERLQRGATVLEARPVDLGRLVREWVASTDLLVDRRSSVEVDPVTIQADPAMLERIVENLIGNTVKHTPSDSQIWIKVDRTADGVLLTVEDDGPGVPEHERDRIFEPFRQGTRSGPGSGVGLALVASFAALHGGRAWVDERHGGGASFKVTLAADPPRDDRDQRPVSAGSSSADESQE
jgi:PAS domain S-box-containing protein